LHLADLLARSVTDRATQRLGRLVDVVARLRADDYPPVIGLVVAVGARRLFVPLEQVVCLDGPGLVLSRTTVDLREFQRRPGEVLLRADVLGHRLIDLREARLVRARDIEVTTRDGIWLVSRVDIEQRGWLRRLVSRRPPTHVAQDWKAFEPLVGPEHRGVVRAASGLRRLKVAQIADLLEEASPPEQTEILADLHAHPELEADVFEELDDHHAIRLLGERSDTEIAAVLARMRADDAADRLAELPQSRRQRVLELLPTHQRVKVRMLLGFNPTSAGGLMGVDFVTVAAQATVAAALSGVAHASAVQPEALTSVHIVDDRGRLHAVVPLVRLVQADPAAVVTEVADADPVRVGPDTDVVDVVLVMSDHNLLTVPVVDHDGRMIGVITVDDALETTVPLDWRRREPPPPPGHHRADHTASRGPVPGALT
jgi:CBS domain-containing protein